MDETTTSRSNALTRGEVARTAGGTIFAGSELKVRGIF
jgi:hypothetical protein